MLKDKQDIPAKDVVVRDREEMPTSSRVTAADTDQELPELPMAKTEVEDTRIKQ